MKAAAFHLPRFHYARNAPHRKADAFNLSGRSPLLLFGTRRIAQFGSPRIGANSSTQRA
jgi:hypothetical protein